MNIKTIATALLAACICYACDSDNDNEYHSTYFYPLSSNGIETYADQTVDSVRVISYDSWSLDNNCDWCVISSNGQQTPLRITIPAGYVASSRLDFALQPNQTGRLRTNRIAVVSSYGKVGTISQMLVQYPHLNVTFPDGVISGSGTDYACKFSLSIPAAGVAPSGNKPFVKFVVYTDNATLSSSADWLVPAETSGFRKYEKVKVELNAEPNPGTQERTATLTLTSNGVNTPITISQLGQKEEQ